MKTLILFIFFTTITTVHAKGVEISFSTDDGVTIYGDIYTNPNTPKYAPLILLFHQGGGDARGEYKDLIPRLLQEGYNAIAIDQRSGGERFDGVNRTLAALGSTEYSYCEAYPDLEGALRFAKDHGFSGKTAVWGSSYSAALVFKLGVEHADEIDAVLAFSPASGDAMEGCRPEKYSDQVSLPVLALRPVGELEVPYVPSQIETFRRHGHQTHVAEPGVHGSSMLNAERVGGSTESTWAVVLNFLEQALSTSLATDRN